MAGMLRALILVSPLLVTGCMPAAQQVRVEGVFWQPDAQTLEPHGNWDALGVHTLVVQWSMVGELGLVDGCGSREWRGDKPDWARIAAQPWAGKLIVGLAGEFDEAKARGNLPLLTERSRCVVAQRPQGNVAGWYFPVEIDPAWDTAPQLAEQLRDLPRPLWVSVYDNSNVGGPALAQWLAAWLPADVGVFFQDGVGLHTREPRVAREYMRALRRELGTERVRLIAETFRPKGPGKGEGFRAATVDELAAQLASYRGERVYLFEGPHYLDEAAVLALKQRLDATP